MIKGWDKKLIAYKKLFKVSNPISEKMPNENTQKPT